MDDPHLMRGFALRGLQGLADERVLQRAAEKDPDFEVFLLWPDKEVTDLYASIRIRTAPLFLLQFTSGSHEVGFSAVGVFVWTFSLLNSAISAALLARASFFMASALWRSCG